MSHDREDHIRFAAYILWEREGRPHGRDLDFWFEAEQQLLIAGQIKQRNEEHDYDHVKVINYSKDK